jgi:TPR repeat protein
MEWPGLGKLGFVLASLALSAGLTAPVAGGQESPNYQQGRKAYSERRFGEAARWYRLAAEKGEAEAQFELAGMYRRGEGLLQSYGQAVKWYRSAANQGHARAQISLGIMYQQGEGVPPDDAQAMKWYQSAADQGNAQAQVNLGVMYQQGLGVPKDPSQPRSGIG